ncbi:TetR/AcrR family transcriptional regulator [Brumimicrobium glaciale]|uniref:TetR/AcrR family transcriptional regulator n=1 Tax=Brumimicrobium glaciale TaxID=200475 RepID=A0A4Q4KJ58_9FLAO|nr:TetR family transcriptional regulator C-terminal domain-containing protein [Brumimicrobium glaciale]RYM32860.1 TetR/AcrR family transcriptional regulator [Brumimicrobium glaciale]
MEVQKINTRDVILENYTNYVLTHNEKPKSVYAFAAESKMEEAEFYEYFNSFKAIDSAVFVDLFKNTHTLLSDNEEFQEGDAKHKLLSFYFTFFEMLTANRSLVMYILKENENKMKTLKTLDGLKEEYTNFVESLDIKSIDMIIDNVASIVDKGVAKVSYGQLLFTLKFWMNDTSPSFEKTDVLIEKSMHAGFEVLNTKPLNTFVSLGKFLWKERMGKN